MSRIESMVDRIVATGENVPRLLGAITLSIAVFAAILIVLPRDEAVFVIAMTLLIAPFPGWGSVIYLWRIYLQDAGRPRSWLLLLVAFVATLVMLALLPVTLLAAVVILPQITISGDDATLILGLALLGAATVPVVLALVFAARRRGKLPPAFVVKPEDETP